MSNFRSIRQHLTRLWRSETKLGLPTAEHFTTMTYKSELMDRLKMTPIGSLSNFSSIEHRLTIHQSAASCSRQNQVYWRRDPTRLQNSNKSQWLSYLLLRKLHLKFQVIPTSLDPVLASNRKSANSAQPSLELFQKIGNFALWYVRILIKFSPENSSQ